MAELLVVATPIGNLKDMSERMKEALGACDLIAAEDTRVTMKLLSHLGIKKPMVSLHRHNEGQKAEPLVRRMVEEDLTVCVTSDAGTPGISDPGIELVRAAIDAGVRVTPIPGPTALAAHLSATGFDARSFAFYGFPPREGKALKENLSKAAARGIPVALFYESPHRVVGLCETILELFPDCHLSVACDLTKLYEVILTGQAAEVVQQLKANPNVEKGEYSVAVSWNAPPQEEQAPASPMPIECALVQKMLSGLSLSEAAESVQAEGRARNEVYKARLALKKLIDREA